MSDFYAKELLNPRYYILMEGRTLKRIQDLFLMMSSFLPSSVFVNSSGNSCGVIAHGCEGLLGITRR